MFYYDHDITVKIMDGVLAHSQDWDWFIQHIETNFTPDLTVDSFECSIRKCNSIGQTLNFLCKINEVLEGNLMISEDWLSNLNKIALFYNGAIKVDKLDFSDDFFKTIKLLVYTGKVYGIGKTEKPLMYSNIFTMRNLFQIEDISAFKSEEEEFIILMSELSYDMSLQISIFEDNIHEIEKIYDGSFLADHSDKIYNADCFNFVGIETNNVSTWQERYLLDMLKTSFRNGKLIPEVTFSSSAYPDFGLWTEDVYCQMKEYFNSDIADFIVETIDFALNKNNIPSQKTINKHFELFIDFVKERIANGISQLYCSSEELIIEFLNNEEAIRLVSTEMKKLYATILEEIQKNGNIEFLLRLNRKKALLNKTIQSALKKELQARVDEVDKISTYVEFISYIEDKDISYMIEQKHIEVLSIKFNDVIKSCTDIHVAHLFYTYFMFLLDIKNNKNVIHNYVKQEIIHIRNLWQNEYFSICCASMTTVTTDAISIKTDTLKSFTQNILINPIKFAKARVKLSTDQLINTMSSISDCAFFAAVDSMIICEDFPYKYFFSIDDKHPIDQLYVSIVEDVKEKNEYKFLNHLDIYKYTQQIYERIKQELSISMGMLIDIEPLYEAVKAQNPDYDLLDYSDNIKLGHITQLFPILENKIRDFGEMCGIVRVCESKELCHRLKEPYTILHNIIQMIYDETKSLLNIADLFFIHFCMFAENGYNIRNECVHGKNYGRGSNMKFAFKLTLISLYMIGYRCQIVLENAPQQTKNN